MENVSKREELGKEQLEHVYRIKEIQEKGSQDRKTEVYKAVGKVVSGVLLIAGWFGFNCLADRKEFPRKNVPKPPTF